MTTRMNLSTAPFFGQHSQVNYLHQIKPLQWRVEGLRFWAGIEDVFGPQEECYACFDPDSVTSIQTALRDLKDYMTADGPFDGVMAFSQGAALAALLLIEEAATRPTRQPPIFKCAIFLSGIVPCDHEELAQGRIRWLDPAYDAEVITVPTTHIWGSNDREYPGISEGLSKLCKADRRREVVHKGGHEIPGTRDESLVDMVQAIKETLRLVTPQ